MAENTNTDTPDVSPAPAPKEEKSPRDQLRDLLIQGRKAEMSANERYERRYDEHGTRSTGYQSGETSHDAEEKGANRDRTSIIIIKDQIDQLRKKYPELANEKFSYSEDPSIDEEARRQLTREREGKGSGLALNDREKEALQSDLENTMRRMKERETPIPAEAKPDEKTELKAEEKKAEEKKEPVQGNIEVTKNKLQAAPEVDEATKAANMASAMLKGMDSNGDGMVKFGQVRDEFNLAMRNEVVKDKLLDSLDAADGKRDGKITDEGMKKALAGFGLDKDALNDAVRGLKNALDQVGTGDKIVNMKDGTTVSPAAAGKGAPQQSRGEGR